MKTRTIEHYADIRHAVAIATEAHAGQFRRDGKTPYIEHPAAVAARVKDEHTDAVVAAWLHDVLEDTHWTEGDLLLAGVRPRAVEAVVALTKVRGMSWNRYLFGIRINPVARVVKIADMEANLADDPTPEQVERYAAALEYLRRVPG